MLEALKKLLGRAGPAAPDGDDSPALPVARWEKKEGRKIKWIRRAAAPGLVPSSAATADPAPRIAAATEESICPTCKRPLLAEWGTNCPRCRPRIAVAMTMALTCANPGVEAGLALGWLVVLESPEKSRKGEIIQLDDVVTMLSRGSRPVPSPGVRRVVFEDEFMSSAHATVRRPFAALRESAFVLEDRRDPAGPSANGVFVNSRRIASDRPYELSDNDIIRLGTTELQFKSLWLPPSRGTTS
jgi:hypothetical protein